MNDAPKISESTVEERRVELGGKDAEHAYADYIMGQRSFLEVAADYKR